MVEGGAQVIASFMAQARDCVDRVIVTVAPVFVGRDGVGYGAQLIGREVGDIVMLAGPVCDCRAVGAGD
jgi:2,5-diamino-6-(ribosylamino)-4(3H)-pyrimidinone 5'-phosphate reductase